MMVKVSLTCSRCGKKYIMARTANTVKAKVSWENWVRKNIKTPYCNQCRFLADPLPDIPAERNNNNHSKSKK